MLALRVIAAFLLALPAAGLALYAHDLGRGEAPYPDGLAGTGIWAGESGRANRPSVPRRTAQSLEPDVRFADTPRFVVDIDPIGPDGYVDEPANGVQILLFDQQLDATGRESIGYSRWVGRTTNEVGLSTITSFEVALDPALHTLEIHEVTAVRDGETLDLRDDVSVDFLRQEDALSSGIFSGNITALVRVPTFRVGDVADISYSIRQNHPVIGNRHTSFMSFAFEREIDRLHYRSVWPRGDVVSAHLGPDVELETTDETRQTVITFGPALYQPGKRETYIPAWRYPAPFFIGTRFDDWQDVARWAEPFYQPEVTDEVAAIADQIRAMAPDRDDQIAEALRYVQREVRYFAILLGDGGYVPLTPGETLRYGEGDCKAKSVLLLSILEALGIEARAALVSTTIGRGLSDVPATPLAFDHVIVTLEHDGRRYWLDPTQPEQAGRLDRITPALFGQALIVDPETDTLTGMGEYENDRPFVEVEENVRILSAEPGDNRADLNMVWRIRGVAADQLRALMDQIGETAARQNFDNIYTSRFETGEAQIDQDLIDDREENEIRYYWRGEVTLPDYSTEETGAPIHVLAAHAPSVSYLYSDLNNRTMPLALPYPYHAQQTTVIELPEGTEAWLPEETGYVAETESFLEQFSIGVEALTVTLRAETHIRSAELLPDEFEAARAAANERLDSSHYVLIGGEEETGDYENPYLGAMFTQTYPTYLGDSAEGAAY